MSHVCCLCKQSVFKVFATQRCRFPLSPCGWTLQPNVLDLVGPGEEQCCSSELTRVDSPRIQKNPEDKTLSTSCSLASWFLSITGEPTMEASSSGGPCMMFGDQKHWGYASRGVYKVGDLFSKVWTRHPIVWLKILSKLNWISSG